MALEGEEGPMALEGEEGPIALEGEEGPMACSLCSTFIPEGQWGHVHVSIYQGRNS